MFVYCEKNLDRFDSLNDDSNKYYSGISFDFDSKIQKQFQVLIAGQL